MRSFLSLFGSTGGQAIARSPGVAEYRIPQFMLRRVLKYTGHTIDEVINDASVRYEVAGYYKLSRQLERRCDEMSEQAPYAGASKILL
jgi:hypothetical protein